MKQKISIDISIPVIALVIFILIFLCSYKSKAQGYISPEIGYSSKKAMQASLQAGYQLHNVFVEGDLRFNCNRHDAALFGARVGYRIPIRDWNVEPLLSSYYRMISTDKKYLNGFVYGAGIRIQMPCMVTFQASYVDKTCFIGIGFKSL